MEVKEVEQLAEEYGADVMRFCKKLTRCAADAQDLYQQSFLRLMQLRVKIDRENNPRAFLFSIVNGIWKNECRKLGRRAQIAPTVSTEEEQESGEARRDVQDDVLNGFLYEELAQAVQNLDSKYQTPIVLMYYFDMKIEDIARIERVAQGTVKSRLNRAKEKLRKEMEARGYGRL